MELLYLSVQTDIESKIRNGEWKENEQIPSERLLSKQYGVSRTVVREALKRLSEENLIINRMGKGSYVSRPQKSDVINSMGNAIELSHIPIADIIDAREDIELLIARYSIYKIGENGILRLKQLAQNMDNVLYDTKRFSDLDGQFHMSFAESCGNQVLGIFARALNQVIDRRIIYGDTPKIRQNAQQEHKLMIRALEDRNLPALEAAVRRHMACIRFHVYKKAEQQISGECGSENKKKDEACEGVRTDN